MSSHTSPKRAEAGLDAAKKRLEHLKAERDQTEDSRSRVARAVEAVASIGVKYNTIDAETWKVIAQHPDLEAF